MQLKTSYDIHEWKLREEYYINKATAIIIPPLPTPKEVLYLSSVIDNLLTEALFDFGETKRRYLTAKTNVNLAEKELFLITKQTTLAELTKIDPKAKLTENEIKSLVVSNLRKNTTANSKYSVYQIQEITESRFTFMEALVKALQEKKSALVTDNGMLKLEAMMGPTRPQGVDY